jgi:hypothetical protein
MVFFTSADALPLIAETGNPEKDDSLRILRILQIKRLRRTFQKMRPCLPMPKQKPAGFAPTGRV